MVYLISLSQLWFSSLRISKHSLRRTFRVPMQRRCQYLMASTHALWSMEKACFAIHAHIASIFRYEGFNIICISFFLVLAPAINRAFDMKGLQLLVGCQYKKIKGFPWLISTDVSKRKIIPTNVVVNNTDTSLPRQNGHQCTEYIFSKSLCWSMVFGFPLKFHWC